jgi:succinyl-diaminopimelate desuccinylase
MKELLKRLVSAETTAQTGELAAAEIIADELGRSGIDAQIESWDGNRANLFAQVESGRKKGGLLFACHLDVVPPGEESWKHPPFTATESDGRIYGRGSADMKGGIVAAVTAIRQIVDSGAKLKGDIMLLCAAGEETDSCGAERFVRNRGEGCEPGGVVITEPTDFDVVAAHRGLLWLEVTTKGKAAHSSTPELGVNAITSMKSLLNELDSYEIAHEPHELLGRCSMSINTISGGKTFNTVADRCIIGIDIRTLPGQSHQDIIDDFHQIFARLKEEGAQCPGHEFKAEVSIVRSVSALETDPQSDFVKNFCAAVGAKETKAVGFTTDGPHFGPLGAPVVVFGPGKPEVCHKPDEYIDISDLRKGVEYYKNVILRFLS